VSLLLFAIGFVCLRSTAFRNQSMAASKVEAEPPLVPFLLPPVLLAAIRGPAVVFSTFDLGESRNLFFLPTGILWWWWVGRQLDSRARRTYRRAGLRGTLYAIAAILVGSASVFLIANVSQRYWRHPYFGLSDWRGAMWTADVLWLGALTVIVAAKSLLSFRSSNAIQP
jgi:hypothetical protein